MRCLLFNRQHFCQPENRPQSGFTLIELLLIIVLLGVLAVAAINAFEGNEDQGRENITRLEMVQLQKALLQFRRDTRELPCWVYLDGVYSPNSDMETVYTFVSENPSLETDPASPASPEDYELWCSDSLPAQSSPPNLPPEDVIQAENALTMLNRFPYDDAAYDEFYWEASRQRGWNGPYVSKDALKDGWGRPYKLLNPELAFNQSYRCKNDGTEKYVFITNSETAKDEYNCKRVMDSDFDSTFSLPADIARIVSAGADGIYQSLRVDSNNDFGYKPENFNSQADPCAPAKNSDDLVLCLLR